MSSLFPGFSIILILIFLIITSILPLYHKRDLRVPITLSAILSLDLIGAGTGTASVVTHQHAYTNLRNAIHFDIQKTETAISHLQESLSPLSEVVLQNHRGLDLILMQQGGLCTTLGEE